MPSIHSWHHHPPSKEDSFEKYKGFRSILKNSLAESTIRLIVMEHLNEHPFQYPAVSGQMQKIAELLGQARKGKCIHLVNVLHPILLSTLQESARTRWQSLHQDFSRITGRTYFFWQIKNHGLLFHCKLICSTFHPFACTSAESSS